VRRSHNSEPASVPRTSSSGSTKSQSPAESVSGDTSSQYPAELFAAMVKVSALSTQLSLQRQFQLSTTQRRSQWRWQPLNIQPSCSVVSLPQARVSLLAPVRGLTHLEPRSALS
jgi:hypothetical protein